MKSFNQELFDLYNENWSTYLKELNAIAQDNEAKVKPTNPLCLGIKDEKRYFNADLRVMVFGQETNDWGQLNEQTTIESLQESYSSFYGGQEFNKWKGQFRNGYNLLFSKINEIHPDKKVEFVWNNIIKTGRRRVKGIKKSAAGAPTKQIYELEKNHFNIIPGEINILKPDVLIFLTGPSYDKYVRTVFSSGNFEAIQGFKKRQLAQISLINNVKSAVRTYHPAYLYRTGINSYVNKILECTSF